tara:strand:+ start:155 stop:523 length:369 start_codon:yes stop_codon:yes gene_type:complete
MDLFKIFAKNFIYGGLLLGVILTTIDIIKNSQSLVGFYGFMAGSFFIITLIQYNYIRRANHKLSSQFLLHTISGGIFWVLLSILLFYLDYKKSNETMATITILITIACFTILYYYALQHHAK